MRTTIMKMFLIMCLVLVPAAAFCAEEPKEEKKRTPLKKYVNAKEAFTMWHTEPDKVHLLDVRTRFEYQLIGHVESVRNIPYKFLTTEWNAKKKRFKFVENPDFVKHVKQHFKKDDLIIVFCRSGGRSAEAARALIDAGFTNVYTMVDSFEGDKVKDPESYFQGKRMKNGWKNAGLPWTYDIDPDLAYRPGADKGAKEASAGDKAQTN